MACKKCSSKRQFPNHFFIEKEAGDTAVIFTSDNRLLQSQINGIIALVKANVATTVYLSDLSFWIKNGLRGIRFANVHEEAEFLTKYPDISKVMYV